MISALKIFVDELDIGNIQEYIAAAVDIFIVQEMASVAF